MKKSFTVLEGGFFRKPSRTETALLPSPYTCQQDLYDHLCASFWWSRGLAQQAHLLGVFGVCFGSLTKGNTLKISDEVMMNSLILVPKLFVHNLVSTSTSTHAMKYQQQ